MIERFWDWVDQRSIVRRIVLFLTVWMTWRAFQWAAVFAASTPKSGMEVAAIIAAVTAPITYLQSAAFKTYSEGRKE
jgi:hypothetical protein